MNLSVTEAVLQLISLGLQIVPEMVSAAQTEIALFRSGGTPTAAQQADIEAALEKAHAALQAA